MVRILFIEDDPKINRVVRQALQEEGYAVDVAFDGDRGEELAYVNAYDAVILDLMLPGRPGLEVCRTMRAAGNATPVLMLTARDGVQDRVEGLDAGADDYLVKPFHIEELLARVRALLRRGAPVRMRHLAVGDLVIDTAARLVTLCGCPVILTNTEFAILEYMAQHAGEVVTRSVLMDHVWDENYEGLSNIVDVYIRRLRAKLEAAGSEPIVETVRGAGYKLRIPADGAVPA